MLKVIVCVEAHLFIMLHNDLKKKKLRHQVQRILVVQEVSPLKSQWLVSSWQLLLFCWWSELGHQYSLKRIAMKIIPVDFWTVMLIAQKWNSTNLTKKYLNTWFCRIGQVTVNNNNHNSKTNLIYIAAYIKSSLSMACIIMAIMPPIFRKSRKSNGISWSLLMWIVERRTNQLTSVENDAWANFIIATLANLTTPFSNSHNKLAIYVNRKSNVDLSQTAFQLRGVTQSHRRSICGKLGASLGPSS